MEILAKQLFIFVFVWTSARAEIAAQAESPDVRYMEHPPADSKSGVVSVQDMEQYLHSYGYLECEPQPKRDKDRSTTLIPPPEASARPNTHKFCTEAEIQTALDKFEANFHLAPTGLFDNSVQSIMNEPRCGDPDDPKEFEKQPPLPRIEDSPIPLKRHKREAPILEPFMITPEVEQKYRHLDSPAFRRRKRAILEEDMEAKEPSRVRVRRAVKLNHQAVFNKEVIRWRYIAPYSRYIDIPHVRFAIRMAFRYWAEVCHLRFVEDNLSDIRNVELEVGFGEYTHFNCKVRFDGWGGQFAHTTKSGPIHFDDSDALNSNLIRVIVHEIGHALGLPHNFDANSVMFPTQKAGLRGHFELSKVDRTAVQNLYGKCSGHFDVVIDWIQMRTHRSSTEVYRTPKFSTYMFRNNIYWLYNDTARRPRYGDPNVFQWGWPTVPVNLNTIIQVWDPRDYGFNVFSAFLKGNMVYVYDGKKDKVRAGYPKPINQVFGRKSPTDEDVPANVNAAYFDWRTSRIHFFKDDWVYIYDPGFKFQRSQSSWGASRQPHFTQDLIQLNNCCERKVHFSELYRMASNPRGPALTPPIDVAYYSNARESLIFFKGDQYWIDRCFDLKTYAVDSCVEYAGKWNSAWEDVCGA